MVRTIILLISLIKPFKTLNFRVIGWGERPFAFCNNGQIAISLPSRIKLIDTTTWFTKLQVETSGAITISASPDGGRLIVGRDATKDNLYILNLSTLEKRYLKGHSQAVHSVSWSSNGRWLVSGGVDSTVIIWDAKNGSIVKKFRNGSFVYVVAWSPNGKYLAYGTAAGRIVVVRAPTWKKVMDIDPNHGAIYSLAWSHDGRKLAVTTGWPDNTLMVFSTAWKQEMELTPHLSTIWSVDWSPDDKFLITASGDSTLKIISYPDGDVEDQFRSRESWFESVMWVDNMIVASRWDGAVQFFRWSRSEYIAQNNQSGHNVANSESEQKPEIVLFDPEVDQNGRGTVFLQAREGEVVPVKGFVYAPAGIDKVLVNSIEADVTKIKPNGAKFEAYIPVHEGVNRVNIVAKDKKGNISRQNLTIIGESSPNILPRTGEIWAVVVGVDTYADPRINLKYASSDARSFANFLIGPHVGARSDHVITLLNKDATRANILKNLMKVARMARETDLVIVYMAMHGLPELGKLYFLPHDGDPTNIVGTGISRDDIVDIFEWPDKRLRVLFIFDVCHAGAFDMIASLFSSNDLHARNVLAKTTNDLLYRITSSRPGISVLASTSVYDLSYEDDRLKHGIFTYYLLEGLSGKADHNGDGIVTLGEVADYVRNKTVNATGGKQVPQMRGDRNLPLSKVY